MVYQYQKNFYKFYQKTVENAYSQEKRKEKSKKIIKIIEKYLSQTQKAPLKTMKAIDIGCSVGHITAHIAPYVSEIIGTDIDQDAIELARKHHKTIPILQYMVADSMSLPFPDHSFDLVICTQVYEHVPDSQQLMREIWRILVRGGVCYFAATQRFVLIEPHYKLPFLSWLPKSLSNIYLKITGRGEEYYENLLSYRNLKKLTSDFIIHDYTIDVIKRPYEYDAMYIKSNKFISLALNIPFIKYILPGYLWIIEKK